MVEEGIADERDTLEFLLGRSKRDATPLRVAFVHDPRPGGGPGPLSEFMRRPDALSLFILLLAVAVNPPHNVRFPAAVWSRALGRGDNANAELWVSKSLRWLEDQQLIVRRRVGREREITVLHESGNRSKYHRPSGRGDPFERFFNLSHRYFLEGWHKQLSAPGKAVLLVAHASAAEFSLPLRQGEKWWGLSAETLSRGLDELRDYGLLSVRTTRKKAPELRHGFTLVPLYHLTGPFARKTTTVAGSKSAKRSEKRSVAPRRRR